MQIALLVNITPLNASMCSIKNVMFATNICFLVQVFVPLPPHKYKMCFNISGAVQKESF